MRKQYCTTDQQVSKGCRYALHVDHDSVTVKKKNRPTKDLLLYSFLLEYLIDVLDKNTPQKNLLLLLLTRSENLSGQPHKNLID